MLGNGSMTDLAAQIVDWFFDMPHLGPLRRRQLNPLDFDLFVCHTNSPGSKDAVD
jgi:hypothetical protein